MANANNILPDTGAELLINVDNHSEWDQDPDQVSVTKFEETKRVFDSIDKYLVSFLGADDNISWGRSYAQFLEGFALEPNSSNGWWSVEAVCEDNIKAFLQYCVADKSGEYEEFLDEIHEARDAISNTRRVGEIRMIHRTVQDILRVMSTQYVSIFQSDCCPSLSDLDSDKLDLDQVLMRYGNVELRFLNFGSYSFTFAGTSMDGTIVKAGIGGHAAALEGITVQADQTHRIKDDRWDWIALERDDEEIFFHSDGW